MHARTAARRAARKTELARHALLPAYTRAHKTGDSAQKETQQPHNTGDGRGAGSGCTTAVAGVDATVVLTAAGLVGVAVAGVGATAAAVTTGCCGVTVAAAGFAVAGAGVTTGRVIALAIATFAADAVVGVATAGARDGKGCTIAVVLACVTGAGLVAACTGWTRARAAVTA